VTPEHFNASLSHDNAIPLLIDMFGDSKRCRMTTVVLGHLVENVLSGLFYIKKAAMARESHVKCVTVLLKFSVGHAVKRPAPASSTITRFGRNPERRIS
jgi:hypothetical protein